MLFVDPKLKVISRIDPRSYGQRLRQDPMAGSSTSRVAAGLSLSPPHCSNGQALNLAREGTKIDGVM